MLQLLQKNISTVRKSLCNRKKHKKVLANGVPNDAILGIKNYDERLPKFYFGGMRNITNEPLQLLFNEGELCLKFEKSIQKHEIRTIERVFFEPIIGHEEYYIMCLQLDKTRHSKFWIYWVPGQYRKAIEDLINEHFCFLTR